ncbi:MAG: tetratricopeptide repeat protein [Saprospiraceae bacterium]
MILLPVLVTLGCKSDPKNIVEEGMTGNPEIDLVTDSIKSDPQNLNLYLHRAQIYYDNQAYDQAITDLVRVMRIDSVNLKAHHLLADVYMDHLQSSIALQTMERAAKLYPDSIPTKLKLTEFQLILKQYGAAMNTLADIMKIHPGDPEALFMLGMVYRDQGKTEQAIGAFQSAVERDPDNADAWVILGDLMDRTHNPLAIQYFDNAIRVAPKNVAAWHAKAYFLQNNNRIPEALEIYRHIHTMDPQYAEAYLNSAILLMYHDSLEAATKELDILQKIDPTNAATWFYKGKIHQLRGEKELAKADYEQALRLDDKYDQARDALQEIKE